MEITAETRRKTPLSRLHLEQALRPLGARPTRDGFILRPMEGAEIRVVRDGWQWRFSTDTELHGAGLHYAFYEMLSGLAPELKVTYRISDPTGYIKDMNVERLRGFYREELQSIADDLAKLPEDGRLHTHWALPGYALTEGSGVACALSRWSRDLFLSRVKDEPDKLAEDFFIAPNPGRDGVMLRNQALYLLQNEITYLRSGEEAMAARVCRALEEAASLHPTLPLPLEEYRRCAEMAGLEAQTLSNPRLTWGLIGYRRELLRHEMGGFSWVHPGHFDAEPAEDEPWMFLGDDSFSCHWALVPYEEGDTWDDLPVLEKAEAFRGAEAPELCPDETSHGLKAACRLGDRRLIVLVSYKAPYAESDVFDMLNSVEETEE